jgi:arylsulfatase
VLATASLLAAAVLGAACARSSTVVPNANVVLVIIDTLRADHLGAYGYARDTSPTLDRLAREGALFERVIAQGSWTPPAVGSIFTSLYPHVHGAVGFRQGISDQAVTLPEALKAAGYATFGIQTNASLAKSFSRGFDSYEEMFGRRRSIAARFEEHLARVRDGKFFAYLHLMDVHIPYNADESFRNRFVAPYTGSLLRPDRIGVQDQMRLRNLVSSRRPGAAKRLTDADRRHVIGHYDAGVAEADHRVGLVVAALERAGVADTTIVIVVADHGEELFDHGSYGHGHSLHREVVRVPLILKHPGLRKRGLRIRQLVRQIDIFPTILGFLGIARPPMLMGRDLGPALLAPEEDWGLVGFTEAMRVGPTQFAVEQGRDKLYRIQPPDNARQRRFLRLVVRAYSLLNGAVERYDLQEDPEERRPIVAPDGQDRLARLLDTERKTGESLRLTTRPEEVDREQINRLRSLGYVH